MNLRNFYMVIFVALLVLSILFIAGGAGQEEKTISIARERNVLYLFNWNNYIAPDTIKRFEQSCNCELSQDYYSDNEEMLAKLAAGATGYDLIVPTGNAMDSLIRQGALQPLNKSLLPNLKNLNPIYLNTAFDP